MPIINEQMGILPFYDGGITISPFSKECLAMMPSTLAAPSSAVYPNANRAIAFPFRIGAPLLVQVMWTFNGGAVAGNVDVGIYDYGFRLLVSSGGAVAQAGINQIQTYNVTDTLLGPGVYYLAISESSAASTFFRYAQSWYFLGLMGVTHMAAANPLPAIFVPSLAGYSYQPMFGLCARSFV